MRRNIDLGMVASGKRAIVSGSQFDRYFEESLGNEVVLIESGDVVDTIDAMRKVISKTLGQTKDIAVLLAGSSRLETSRNIWEFLYRHVQYTKDNPLREQLRTPARLWHDRKRGVDCDCYSIFISSVLTNLKVPHALRIAAYSRDFQHVYVIVPKSGSDYSSHYTIDPVLDTFDVEATYSKKKDFPMKVTMLNGPGFAPFAGFGACPPKNTAMSSGSASSSNPSNANANTSNSKPSAVQIEPIKALAPTPPATTQKAAITTQSTQPPAKATTTQPPVAKAAIDMPTVGKILMGGVLMGLAYWAFSDSGPKPKILGRVAAPKKAVSRRVPSRKRMAVLEM